MENTSNKFLKVTGILMIIGGILGVLVGLIAVLGLGALIAALGGTINAALLTVATILTLGGSAIQLIAGILGVSNAAKPEKANICIIFGILTAALSVLGNILTVASGGNFNFISMLLGLVIPVLYLVGAFQNKKLDVA